MSRYWALISMRYSPWSIGVVGILVCTGILNCLVGYFAFSTRVAPMEDSPYERGLSYTETQQKLSLPNTLGWQWEFGVKALSSSNKRAIRFQLLDSRSVPISGATVRMIAKRYDTPAWDITTSLVEYEPGIYGASVEMPTPAQWAFEIEIHSGAEVAELAFQRFVTAESK